MPVFSVSDPRFIKPIQVEAKTKPAAYKRALRLHNKTYNTTISHHKGFYERWITLVSVDPVVPPTPRAEGSHLRTQPKGPWKDVPSKKKSKPKRKPRNEMPTGKELREKVDRMKKYNKKRGLTNA